MKSASSTATLLALLFLSTSSAQLIPFFTNNKPPPPPYRRDLDRNPQHLQPAQVPFPNTPNIQMPDTPSTPNPRKPDDDNNQPTGSIILSDVLPTQPTIQIFAGLLQDVSSTSTRLAAPLLNTTVLAPLNRAITSLPRKPWEDPRDYGVLGVGAYGGDEGKDRAAANLRRFTEAHVVPVSPWGEGEKVESVGGGTVWWEKREDGKRVVMPGGVEVEAVVSRVANGEVWVLREVLNYV